jgi:hypothetical protein
LYYKKLVIEMSTVTLQLIPIKKVIKTI